MLLINIVLIRTKLKFVVMFIFPRIPRWIVLWIPIHFIQVGRNSDDSRKKKTFYCHISQCTWCDGVSLTHALSVDQEWEYSMWYSVHVSIWMTLSKRRKFSPHSAFNLFRINSHCCASNEAVSLGNCYCLRIKKHSQHPWFPIQCLLFILHHNHYSLLNLSFVICFFIRVTVYDLMIISTIH